MWTWGGWKGAEGVASEAAWTGARGRAHGRALRPGDGGGGTWLGSLALTHTHLDGVARYPTHLDGVEEEVVGHDRQRPRVIPAVRVLRSERADGQGRRAAAGSAGGRRGAWRRRRATWLLTMARRVS